MRSAGAIGTLGLAGCAQESSEGTNTEDGGGSTGGGSSGGNTLKIGLSNPLSGPYASVGEFNVEGFKLKAEQLNENGGVLGKNVELFVEDLERKDFVKYAGASGDFNPLHYDEPYAKETGNESVFGQGMLTAGHVARMVTDWFGLDRVSGFTVRFQAPVWPGDTITVTGEVTEVVETDDGETVTADLVGANEDDEAVITGSVTATLPAEEAP